MRLSGQFQSVSFFFFFEKRLDKKQLLKQKHTNTKQQKQHLFAHKTPKRGRNVCFAFWCFFFT